MSVPQVDTIRRLGDVSRTYEKAAVEYGALAVDAAQSEADYRRLKAVFVTRLVNDGSTVTKAEYAADADDAVAAACQRFKLAAALLDAARSRLSQLKSQLDFGRSVLTTEREADRLAASGMTP